jgi:hypothetical protein
MKIDFANARISGNSVRLYSYKMNRVPAMV